MNTNLIDQIGAMSIVDKLRFQTDRVQDYMNTSEQKSKLIEKITSGYKAEGAEVPASVIEEGVNQWYERRLKLKEFESPWYVQLYVSREKWLKKLLTVVGITIIVISLISLAFSIHHGSALKERRNEITSALVHIQEINPLKLDEFKDYKKYPFVLDRLSQIEDGNDKLKTLKNKIDTETNLRLNDLSLSVLPNIDQLLLLINEYSNLQKSLRSIKSQLYSFKNQYETFVFLNNDPYVINNKLIEDSKRNVENLLLKPNLSIQDLNRAVASFSDLVVRAHSIDQIRSELASLKERALKQLTDENDKIAVQSISTRISSSIEKLVLPDESDMDHLRNIEKLSRTNLRLIINPNNKYKNAVERIYHGSGGKAWYVIVQPLDEADKPFSLKIKSSETGVERFVDVFGIKVTKERYDRLKLDKQDNGIIDNNLIGTKPVGKINFTFDQEISPEYILEW